MNKTINETKEIKRVKSIFLFSNGNMGVCDENGEQIGELQVNVIMEIFKKAEKLGFIVSDDVEILLPNGREAVKVKDNIRFKENGKNKK